MRTVRNVLQDLKYVWQTTRRSPAFVIAVILILAVGTGANTAIFSVLNGIVLRPLPFPDSDRLVSITSSQPSEKLSRIKTSNPDFEDFRDRNHTFEQIGAAIPFTETLVGLGEPQVLRCTAASPEFYSILGIRPVLGRLYRPEEYHEDAVKLLISYNFWQRMFGGDPQVIGRTINLGNSNQLIIGVMPPLPDIYPETDAWPTLVPDFQFMKWRGSRFLDIYGRLKPGVTTKQAEEDLTAILGRAPETPRGMRESITSLKSDLVGNIRPILVLLLGAAGLVLLIACVNVASLLLARSENRKQEIAVRISLGANRSRILSQLFTENLMIAIAGTVAGIFLASTAIKLIVRAGAAQLPRSSSVGINLPVMIFTLIIACLTSLLFGFAPSLALLKTDLNSALRAGRSDTGSSNRSRRTLLIVAEVGLSVILLVGAGLLMRSLTNLMQLDLGFQPDHLLTSHLRLASDTTQYDLNFYRRLLAEMPTKPGIESVAVADCIPGLRAPSASLIMSDKPVDPKHLPGTSGCWISADYFRAIGTPLLAGRMFSPRDDGTAPLVAIVNNSFARRFWQNESPIGKRIHVSYTGPGRTSDGVLRWREIVGVVADVKQNGLDTNPDAAVYMPFYQDETAHVYRSMRLFVRGVPNAGGLAGTVRAGLRQIEPDLPANVQTMPEVLSQSVSSRRFTLLLLSSFATLATLLAGFGIYGVVTYSVTRRTREIGLRMALGASRGRVLGMVLKEVLIPVVGGSLLGGLSAIAASGWMSNILYRTPPADPLVLSATVAIMLLVSLAAAAIPAQRAASTDPQSALRAE